MNSFKDLNGYSSNLVTYEDSRTANIIFNKNVTNNQTVNIERFDTHLVPTGIEVIDIIDYATVLPTYTIDVSVVTDATITFATLPSYITVFNTTPGVYIVTGMRSVTDWDLIKSPQINIPSTYTGTFVYTPVITYFGSSTKSWTVTVVVADVIYFQDPAPDFYFANGMTNLLITPDIITNKPGTYVVTITPANTSYVTLMESSVSDPGPACVFNATTKVLTITGSNETVKYYLDKINVTFAPSATSNTTFAYLGTCDNPGVGTDSVTQTLIPTLYLSLPQANGNYIIGGTNDIDNAPFINNSAVDPYGREDLSYTLTVTPSPITNVTAFLAPSWQEYNPTGTFSNVASSSGLIPERLRLDAANNVYILVSSGGVSKNGQTMFTLSGAKSFDVDQSGVHHVVAVDGSDRTYYYNCADIYNVVSLGYVDGGFDVSISNDGTKMLTQNGSVNYRQFTRSGDSWTFQATGGNLGLSGSGRGKVSGDGNYFVTTSRNFAGTPTVLIKTWAGVTQATITNPGSNSLFGDHIEINNDGSTVFISAEGGSGVNGLVYVYTRSGSTWTLSQTLDGPSQGDGYDNFGKERMSLSRNNQYISIPHALYAQVFVYKLVSGVWTYLDYIDPVDPSLGALGDCVMSSDGQSIVFVETLNAAGSDVAFSKNSLTNYMGSFNATTKVYTFVGSKRRINTALAALTMTTNSSSTGNITLTYQVTTPASATESRTQIIEPI